MKLGDIHWVESVSRGGHEQSGRRSAIVFQNEATSSLLPTLLVIPRTTQQSALRFPGTVLVEAAIENGLNRASVALVFQLTAIDRRLLGAKIGAVGDDILTVLRAALDEISREGTIGADE